MLQDESTFDASDELEDEKEELYEHTVIKVDRGQQPIRIDKFLTNRLEAVSRSRIQNVADAGLLMVNGAPVKVNYKIKPLDEITILVTKASHEYKLEPEDIPLNIVYEDDSIVIINKQVGLVVHPGSGNYTGTLVNALLHHFGNNLPTGKNSSDIRPGLVHRIDKDTTGLMIIAKDEAVMTHLAKQFFDHTIKRRYVALVWGDVVEDEGTINVNLARNLRFRKKMDVFPDGDHGKHAITHYKVLERLGYVTLVECILETGRTHQIRVHMMSIGHPLFNDSTYGGDEIRKGTIYSKYKQFVDNCFKLMPRQALHAKVLGFCHPVLKKEMLFESPLPEDFESVLEKWRHYNKYKKD